MDKNKNKMDHAQLDMYLIIIMGILYNYVCKRRLLQLFMRYGFVQVKIVNITRMETTILFIKQLISRNIDIKIAFV